MDSILGHRTRMPSPEGALPGRHTRSYAVQPAHVVLGTPLEGPWPDGSQVIYLAMGCFWGVERIFWRQPGVVVTAAGYMGGYTPHPTYEETCTGLTGHAETVQVVYDPTLVSAEALLAVFWENHDPTQGPRQGNDIGTAYRSAIYWTTPEQEAAALATRDAFQTVLTATGSGRSRPRSGRQRMPGSSTSPRTTTRAICTRIPAATATTGQTASPVRWAS